MTTLRQRILRCLACAVVAAMAGACWVSAGGLAAGPRPVASDPTWSPDGRTIVFSYADASGYSIVTAPATGGGSVRTLYSTRAMNGCCDPMQWASGRILYVANFTLTSMAATGGRPTRLFSSTPQFIVSPNRRTVALDDGCDCHDSRDAIAFIGVTGGTLARIPKPRNAADIADGFSPDGAELVFTRYTYPAGASVQAVSTLMAAPVRGGAPVPLRRSHLPGASRVPGDAQQVQWSPDGRWIAYVERARLVLARATGGPARTLETRRFYSFSWSPTSQAIAYTLQSGRIGTADLHGNHPLKWTSASLRVVSESSLDPPQWSPDGRELVFMARSDPTDPPRHVWVVSADGSGLTRIA